MAAPIRPVARGPRPLSRHGVQEWGLLGKGTDRVARGPADTVYPAPHPRGPRPECGMGEGEGGGGGAEVGVARREAAGGPQHRAAARASPAGTPPTPTPRPPRPPPSPRRGAASRGGTWQRRRELVDVIAVAEAARGGGGRL